MKARLLSLLTEHAPLTVFLYAMVSSKQ